LVLKNKELPEWNKPGLKDILSAPERNNRRRENFYIVAQTA